MMNLRKQIIFWLMLGWVGIVQAQDIHYSMFDMAPLNLNPAQTGYFSGTFRIGGIYRTQYPGLGVNTGKFSGYQTPAAYVDIPFALSKADPIKGWLGVGLSFLNDKVGLGDLNTLNGMLSLAYHISLGEGGKTRISLGAKGGLMQQRIDASKLQFETGMIAGGTGTYVPVSENSPANNSVSYPDFSAGLMVTHNADKWNVQAGFAANHLSSPKYQFLGRESKLPLGLVGHVMANVGLSQKLFLRPLAFYQFMAKAQEINTQALLGLHLNEAKDITLLFGGGYRWFDAAVARVGCEIKGLKFGFAYDLNVNKLSNNGRAMGFEVAISYVARLVKTPKIKEVLFCPRF